MSDYRPLRAIHAPPDTKWCPRCSDYIAIDEFSHTASRKDGLNSYCKDHQKAYRDSRTRHHISVVAYEKMLEEQGGKCANVLCQAREPGSSGDRWCIDHDHTCCPGLYSCGLCIRGLLCQRCNVALAMVSDDTEKLRGLMDYLQRDREKHG